MGDNTNTELFDSDFNREDRLQRRQPILTIMNGPQLGRVILLARDKVSFGRSLDADIMVQDQAMSRLHCTVDYCAETEGYRLSDLDSSNGTYLNDKKITDAVLAPQDKIIMGQTIMKYSLGDVLDLQFHGTMDKLINVDELTDLPAKRRFDEELARSVAVAHASAIPLTLLMMDMDGLKRINDTHGHQFGAFSISETGRIIGRIIGERGVASRFGGDEFMAFLTATPLSQALVVAETIRSEILAHDYTREGVKLEPTISIGVAALVMGETAESLFARADAALYRAKQCGRNCVRT